MKSLFRVFCALLTCLAVFSLITLSGCKKSSGSDGGASISGKVTYKNAPVTGGKLGFHPESGQPGTEVDIKADGSFSHPNIPVLGKVLVTVVTSHVPKGGDALDPFKGGDKEDIKGGNVDPKMKDIIKEGGVNLIPKNVLKQVEIPAKYEKKDSSGLSWEIKAGTNPEKTFDLQ